MFYALVMLTSGPALDKCHNAGVNEGLEAWRCFAMEYEPKLKTRTVATLMQVLGFKFDGNVATRIDAFERLIHDYEAQSRERVSDDTKIGIVLLGMDDIKIKEHLIRNSARLTTWRDMLEEILEVTRTQQYLNSQPTPMQLGATPHKGKGKEGKGKETKGKGKKGKGKQEDTGKAGKGKGK